MIRASVTKRNFAFLVIGLPSWTLIDVTWSMLSQLADRVPEGYNISAYLILSLTLGNVVPLLANSSLKSSSLAGMRRVIGGILTTGCFCGVAMALLWHTTIAAGGHDYSLVFCLLFFVVGACSATSNVTHFTYVSVFPSNETTALSTGMAIGSMLAGVLGILQGTLLGDAGMSISANYFLVAALYLPALYLVWTEAPLILPPTLVGSEEAGEGTGDFTPLLRRSIGDEETGSSHRSSKECGCLDAGGMREDEARKTLGLSDEDCSSSVSSRLLALQLCNCALGYGVVPSLISPVCSRFASSSTVLLLATGFFCILDPVCRAGTAYRPIRSLQGIRNCSLLLYALAAALIATFALPEQSGLLTSQAGGTYAVLVYVGFGVTFGFTNLSVFLYIKTHTHPSMVQDAYRWTGIMSQTGAMCGSIVSFLLVVSGALY